MNKQGVEKLLRRIFKAGAVRRLPRSAADAEVFLALAASSIDPRADYSEPEINARLLEWMDGITNPISFDHVTMRRCMVDARFLMRDDSGKRYRTNQTTISNVIDADARSIHPLTIFREVELDKRLRKRAAAG